jgi:hypothetical protein
MAAPSPLVTIGLGTSPRLITLGMGPVAEAVAEVIRGARRGGRRVYEELEEKVKISAMLLTANGKEIIEPIFNTVTKTFNNDSLIVKILPKKLIARKANDLKVTVKDIKVRKEDEHD